jgi:hypothetical protein
MIPTRKGYYVKAIFGMRMSTLCETRARYEELLRQDLERHDPFQHVVTMRQENIHPLWRNVCNLEAYR